MSRELNQTEIKEFIESNGLDSDVLDDREENLEPWQLECNLLIRGVVNYLDDRFSAIEHRVDRLERLVEERCGYQDDEIST